MGYKFPLWPVWVSILWTLIFFFGLPVVLMVASENPSSSFLWFKLLTSLLTLSAMFAIFACSRGFWKVLSLLPIVLLAFAQVRVWQVFP
jgi:membrane protein insertase Oxa1/YidC/SpoIIIJ